MRHLFSCFFRIPVIILLHACFLPSLIIAQNDSASLITVFQKKNYVQPYFGSFERSIKFISKENDRDINNLYFSPNAAPFAGISLNYKKLNIYLETAIPNTHIVDRENTEVRGSAVFINHFKQNWGVTFFASWNKGLLMYVPGDPMYQSRNDLKVLTTGAHIYSIFNGKGFSYSSANSAASLQTKSKGSFIIMTTPLFRKISSKESIIPESLQPLHLTGENSPSKQIQFLSLQCRPGYIYNFIFNGGKYFFSPAFYAGAGPDYHSFKTDNVQHSGFNLTVGYRIKIVTGINTSDFYLTFEYLQDSNRTFLYKSLISNTYSEISCNMGFRF